MRSSTSRSPTSNSSSSRCSTCARRWCASRRTDRRGYEPFQRRDHVIEDRRRPVLLREPADDPLAGLDLDARLLALRAQTHRDLLTTRSDEHANVTIARALEII